MRGARRVVFGAGARVAIRLVNHGWRCVALLASYAAPLSYFQTLVSKQNGHFQKKAALELVSITKFGSLETCEKFPKMSIDRINFQCAKNHYSISPFTKERVGALSRCAIGRNLRLRLIAIS